VILAALLRNQVALKLRAARAARAVRRYLVSQRYVPVSVETSLGLAHPSKLRIIVIFETDALLSRFESSSERQAVESVGMNALRDSGYPTAGLVSVMSFHSDESIARAGGYRNYFN
jgi:hypothetical protein